MAEVHEAAETKAAPRIPEAALIRDRLESGLPQPSTQEDTHAARERKRREAGWCEGGAPLHVRFPEAVRLAKRLHRANPVTHKRMSFRKISTAL